MKTLLRARKNIAQNSKKGFTLVELIVVIVIIAILIAALLPAVLGAIGSANAAADQADARAIMTALNVWLMELSSNQRAAFLDSLPDDGVIDDAATRPGLGAEFSAPDDSDIDADDAFLNQIGTVIPGFTTAVGGNISEIVFDNDLAVSITYGDRYSDTVRVSMAGGAERGPFPEDGNG